MSDALAAGGRLWLVAEIGCESAAGVRRAWLGLRAPSVSADLAVCLAHLRRSPRPSAALRRQLAARLEKRTLLWPDRETRFAALQLCVLSLPQPPPQALPDLGRSRAAALGRPPAKVVPEAAQVRRPVSTTSVGPGLCSGARVELRPAGVRPLAGSLASGSKSCLQIPRPRPIS